MNDTKNALINFTQRFEAYWLTHCQHLPKSAELHAIPSPCIQTTQALEVYWQSIPMNPNKDLTIVEQVIGLSIRQELHEFYGTQYAGDLSAQFNQLPLTLIQVWSDDDFQRLEQNMLAHLSMQKKLKRQPTLFIATTSDDTQIITVDNMSGEVILEDLINNDVSLLASSLPLFLEQLDPII